MFDTVWRLSTLYAGSRPRRILSARRLRFALTMPQSTVPSQNARKATAVPDARHAAVSTFTKWRTNTETMLTALAAKSDAQERRITALETAAADRRANALAVAQAFAGLFRFALRR
jgi:hypothetical protein